MSFHAHKPRVSQRPIAKPIYGDPCFPIKIPIPAAFHFTFPRNFSIPSPGTSCHLPKWVKFGWPLSTFPNLQMVFQGVGLLVDVHLTTSKISPAVRCIQLKSCLVSSCWVSTSIGAMITDDLLKVPIRNQETHDPERPFGEAKHVSKKSPISQNRGKRKSIQNEGLA